MTLLSVYSLFIYFRFIYFHFIYFPFIYFHLSRVVRKLAFCICQNKDADQLRGNREADQRLYFRYIDSTISLLSIYEISSLWPSCVVVKPGLCGTWSETPKSGFLRTRLISSTSISSTFISSTSNLSTLLIFKK